MAGIVERCIDIYISCSDQVVVYKGFIIKIHIAQQIVLCIVFYSIILQENLSLMEFLLQEIYSLSLI